MIAPDVQKTKMVFVTNDPVYGTYFEQIKGMLVVWAHSVFIGNNLITAYMYTVHVQWIQISVLMNNWTFKNKLKNCVFMESSFLKINFCNFWAYM